MSKLSAGLLPYRFSTDHSLELLLVHPGGPLWKTRDEHAWSVAKGECEPGDSLEETAEREFQEELGLPVPEGRRSDLGEIRQAGGKRVHVWALEVDDLPVDNIVSNEFQMEWPPKSGRQQSFPEVDRAEWMNVSRARYRLVRGQGEIVDRLLELLKGRGTP